jgi:hypothetical protein
MQKYQFITNEEVDFYSFDLTQFKFNTILNSPIGLLRKFAT